MIRLRENDINKLSYLTEISEHDLSKLAALDLINDTAVIDMLIRNDWKAIMRKKTKYTTKQVVQALAIEYDVTPSRVENAIYYKKQLLYSCKECGRTIPKPTAIANGDLCDKCFSRQIKVHSYESSDGSV